MADIARLPRRLKVLRQLQRRVWGRDRDGSYTGAHEYARQLYQSESRQREDARWRREAVPTKVDHGG